MSEQPEALRLADALLKYLGGNTANQAAKELRRLHEENKELLEALKVLLDNNAWLTGETAARAAIKKAEGG